MGWWRGAVRRAGQPEKNSRGSALILSDAEDLTGITQQQVSKWSKRLADREAIALDDLLDADHAENLIRKDFTVSERVAIGKSMAARLGERRGRPTQEKGENFPQFEGERTRDLAAEQAGFGNGKTYEQAEKVCDEGVPELIVIMITIMIAIMDEADISINASGWSTY